MEIVARHQMNRSADVSYPRDVDVQDHFKYGTMAVGNSIEQVSDSLFQGQTEEKSQAQVQGLATKDSIMQSTALDNSM